MEEPKRKAKYIRLSYRGNEIGPTLALLAGPNEARLGASDKSFISLKEDGITIAPGSPGSINFQTLPGGSKYAGMVQDLPFPLAMLPKTLASPLPTHVFTLPMEEFIPAIKSLAALNNLFLGI